MRITGGEAKGRLVHCPDVKGLRPTASKVRQALFNIVKSRIEGARFLDLYAGTGLMGLEALSRGASSLIAIEEDQKLARALEDSLQALGVKGKVIAGNVSSVLKKLEGQAFDIIFADPPYKSQLPGQVLQDIERYDLIDNSGILIIEHTKGYSFPSNTDRLTLLDRRNYGQTSMSFFVKQSNY